jgi:hypothetical protein
MMRRLVPHTIVLVAVLAVLLLAGQCGTGHDSAYLQGLDAWWLEHDTEDRRQACFLSDRYGVEYTAETLAIQFRDDQDHYVMALNRHCA